MRVYLASETVARNFYSLILVEFRDEVKTQEHLRKQSHATRRNKEIRSAPSVLLYIKFEI